MTARSVGLVDLYELAAAPDLGGGREDAEIGDRRVLSLA